MIPAARAGAVDPRCVWITLETTSGGDAVRRRRHGSALQGPALAAVVLSLLLIIQVGGGPRVAAAQTNAEEHSAEFAAMCDQIRALDGSDGIRLGIVVADLGSGERCEVRADESFRSASLYKLVVMAEAERQAELGSFSFDDPLLVEPRHAIDDPPELRPTVSVERTTGEALQRMIQFSSNGDAQALRERLGLSVVDELPASIGMESTELGTEFVTTPDDIATFFEQVAAGTLISRAASASMFELLSGQEINEIIPAGLPDGVPVAHKTGTLDTYLHDAGIVDAPGGRYVLVAMSEHPFSQGAATTLLQQVTALSYEPFAMAATAEPLPPDGLESGETDAEIVNGVIAGLEAGRADASADQASEAAGEAVGAGAETEGGDGGSSGFSLPGISATDVRAGAVGAIAVSGILALLGVFTYGTRLRRSRGAVYNREAVNAVAGGGERTAVMRLGIRKNEHDAEEEVLVEDEELGAAMVPASRSYAEIEAQPVLPSPRLERMANFFAAQQHLLESIHQQYTDEVLPLNTLLARQAYTQQRLLANLENRLRPLNEYADGEEANLDALEQRMVEQGPDFIQRSFSEYLETQRQRIAETRDQIDQQRLPMLAYGDEQRDAVEVALSRFDADIEALELNLAEQRKLLMRMLDAMRSDSFVAVKGFLETREAAMAELADSGITDPGQIGQTVQHLRDAVDAMASQSVHIQSVLEATDESDGRLIESAPGGGPYALPAMHGFEEALSELEAAEADVEAEETVAGA